MTEIVRPRGAPSKLLVAFIGFCLGAIIERHHSLDLVASCRAQQNQGDPTASPVSAVAMDCDSGSGCFDWSRPIGFALVDCDHKVTMLDGKSTPLAATVSWDAKRSCLNVTEAKR